MKSVVSFLHDCRLGKKQVHRNLAVFPVLFPDVIKPYYLTLEEAIDTEMLVVTEVDAAGSVGRLRLRNHAREPILLVEGSGRCPGDGDP